MKINLEKITLEELKRKFISVWKYHKWYKNEAIKRKGELKKQILDLRRKWDEAEEKHKSSYCQGQRDLIERVREECEFGKEEGVQQYQLTDEILDRLAKEVEENHG